MEDRVSVQAGQVLPMGSACSPHPLLSVLQLSSAPTCGCAHFKLLSCTPTKTQLCPYSRHLCWEHQQHPKPRKYWVRDEGARKGRDPYFSSARRGKPLPVPCSCPRVACPPLPGKAPFTALRRDPFITNHPIPSRPFQTDPSCAWPKAPDSWLAPGRSLRSPRGGADRGGSGGWSAAGSPLCAGAP